MIKSCDVPLRKGAVDRFHNCHKNIWLPDSNPEFSIFKVGSLFTYMIFESEKGFGAFVKILSQGRRKRNLDP